ncbi:SulP family inorganic anion transporter [Deinococcus petrolearius]|uniref:SulP family inorganic anion transporter n=1 Tax=Deinococcus petrolearius TaxID=1751295 RepID=A0ABW1DHB6_9DEIO
MNGAARRLCRKNREAGAQGAANIVTGLFGGMAGCAMIGQSMINVGSGGRGRPSACVAGAAPVAVMFVVALSTFDWRSLRNLVTFPRNAGIVTVSSVAGTILTHDLSIGVPSGVVLSAVFLARKGLAAPDRDRRTQRGRANAATWSGARCSPSAPTTPGAFDLHGPLDRVLIDLTHTHLWNSSAVGAIDRVALQVMRRGVDVQVVGMNSAASLLSRVAVYDKPGAVGRLPIHQVPGARDSGRPRAGGGGGQVSTPPPPLTAGRCGAAGRPRRGRGP